MTNEELYLEYLVDNEPEPEPTKKESISIEERRQAIDIRINKEYNINETWTRALENHLCPICKKSTRGKT